MSTKRLHVPSWALRLCLVVLGLSSSKAAAFAGSEPAPVLVGYVKKVVPDPAGGDRQVAIERAQVGMKGTGNTVDSDAHGLFRLQLLQIIRPGQEIEVEVSNVPGWMLYQPADGRLVVPQAPQTVMLRLLPKGSLRFLEHEGLASLTQRMMSEAKDRVHATSAPPPGSPPPPPLDLTGPMQSWADKYGLKLEQVQSAVNQWAKQVLSQKQKDDEQVCLAHYSQGQFEQAATCFDALGQDDVQELQRLQAQTLERTERAVRRFIQAAEARESLYDFAGALREYQAAAKWAKREVSAELWAQVQHNLGIVHWRLATRVEGDAAQRNIGLAVSAYREALTVRTKQALPQDWAATQNNLGNALSDQASQTRGEAGTALLTLAVSAYREALTVQTKQALPQDWAATQNNLGIALKDQASRTQGEAGTTLLALAVSAYREALTVQTKQALPQDRAMTQNNLGTALKDQASRTQGEAGTALLALAVSAYREALTVRTKQALPQDWAMTQNNLGTALKDQASRTQGEAGTALLALAVSAYREALTVQTKQALPQDWAATQNNLGIALKDQASRTQGEAGTALLAMAVSAFREALTVFTKQALPRDWATTQNNLGTALFDQARRTQGEAMTTLLGLAVSAYREALTVFTKQALPQDWAMTKTNLGTAFSNQASRTQGEAGTALLGLAVSAYREALTVRTKQALPQDWAVTQNNLGNALSDQALRTQGEAGTALLGLAVSAYREALTVQTKQALPQDWAMTQNNLGTALRDQASRLPADHPERKDLLTQATDAYRAALTVHTQAVFPIDWARAQANLAQACVLLPDDRCAADGFAAALQVFPDWVEGYIEAYVRYQEKLFLFAQAHALSEQWLARHPDELVVEANFVESHLTTGRWAALPGQLAKVLSKLPIDLQIRLLAIELSALTAQNEAPKAAETRKALRQLVSAQPAEFQITWGFAGTRHYLQTEPRFAPHKQKLLLLLSALEQPSRDAILAALDACCMDSATSP